MAESGLYRRPGRYPLYFARDGEADEAGVLIIR